VLARPKKVPSFRFSTILVITTSYLFHAVCLFSPSLCSLAAAPISIVYLALHAFVFAPEAVPSYLLASQIHVVRSNRSLLRRVVRFGVLIHNCDSLCAAGRNTEPDLPETSFEPSRSRYPGCRAPSHTSLLHNLLVAEPKSRFSFQPWIHHHQPQLPRRWLL
jgi:hypothetical protein